MPSPLTRGLKTTEFYVMVVTIILEILVALKIISSEESKTLKDILVAIIAQVAIVVSSVAYILSRTIIKTKSLSVGLDTSTTDSVDTQG